MTKEKSQNSSASLLNKLARYLVSRKSESCRKKQARLTKIHVRSLPEHTRRDIGWFDG